MRLLIAFVLALTAFSVPTLPAIAAGPAACLNGTAPAGWLRPGGYCEVVANMASTTGGNNGGGKGCRSGGVFGTVCYYTTTANGDMYRTTNWHGQTVYVSFGD